MSRPTVDAFYMSLLDLYATRSTCPRRQVACLITDERNRIVGTGYNGVPSGLPHCNEGFPCPGAEDPSGDTSRCIAIHAEQNALLQCWRLDLARNLYVQILPCFVCAKLICNTAIQRICYFEPYADLKGHNILLQARRQLLQFGRAEFTHGEG